MEVMLFKQVLSVTITSKSNRKAIITRIITPKIASDCRTLFDLFQQNPVSGLFCTISLEIDTHSHNILLHSCTRFYTLSPYDAQIPKKSIIESDLKMEPVKVVFFFCLCNSCISLERKPL